MPIVTHEQHVGNNVAVAAASVAYKRGRDLVEECEGHEECSQEWEGQLDLGICIELALISIQDFDYNTAHNNYPLSS